MKERMNEIKRNDQMKEREINKEQWKWEKGPNERNKKEWDEKKERECFK